MEAKKQAGQVAAGAGIDLSVYAGFMSVVLLIISAILVGGALVAFVDLPSVLIVVLGTIAVTITSFPWSAIKSFPFGIKPALALRAGKTFSQTITENIKLAELCRSKNVQVIESHLDAFKNQPVLHRGLSMAIDGISPEPILHVLNREIELRSERELAAEKILRRSAEIAPAMGLIGTLIGLVQMLGQLEDPESIGPAMAVALLTTLYGAFLAHTVLTPLAERLAQQAEKNDILMLLQLETITSIVSQENPRILEIKLNSMVSGKDQVQYFQ